MACTGKRSIIIIDNGEIEKPNDRKILKNKYGMGILTMILIIIRLLQSIDSVLLLQRDGDRITDPSS